MPHPDRKPLPSALFASHMAAVERLLANYSEIAGHAGHPLHMGLPREAFIREFLGPHLGNRMAIGTGEVFGARSQAFADEKRKQLDIVLYRAEYPKIHFGGSIYGFLIESVEATIEVKTTLDRDGVRQAVRAAQALKDLARHRSVRQECADYQPQALRCFVAAYGTHARDMDTVRAWIDDVSAELGIAFPETPPPELPMRNPLSFPNPSIDGIFVLGKGFVHFDNFRLTVAWDNKRRENPAGKWVVVDAQEGALLFLYMALVTMPAAIDFECFEPFAYVSGDRGLGSGRVEVR